MSPMSQNNPTQAQIVDLTSFCWSFPEMAGTQIPRDNLLQLLDTVLENDFQLVSVEGDEGIGKTTLLAQFAKRHAQRCCSAFLRPTSRFAYDPDIVLHDICDQLNWFLHGEELPPTELIDPASYRQLILALQRRCRGPPR